MLVELSQSWQLETMDLWCRLPLRGFALQLRCRDAYRPECSKLRDSHVADSATFFLFCMSKNGQGQGEAFRALLSVRASKVQHRLLVLR